jgi:hypothetical protein
MRKRAGELNRYNRSNGVFQSSSHRQHLIAAEFKRANDRHMGMDKVRTKWTKNNDGDNKKNDDSDSGDDDQQCRKVPPKNWKPSLTRTDPRDGITQITKRPPLHGIEYSK